MRINKSKKLLKEGKCILGTWAGLGFTDPTLIEIAGYAGFDFILIDMEHSSLDLQTIESMVRAGDAADITTIVRVPENNPKTILRILETGAQGIIIPHTRNREDVEKAINAIKYRPYGDRGIFSGSRAAQYSAVDFKRHMKESNEEILFMVMIEDDFAVEELKEILSVQGLDGIFIGPADLSRSLNALGEQNNPKVVKTIESIFDTVRKSEIDMKIGIPGYHSAFYHSTKELVDLGARMITASPADASLLMRAYKNQLNDMRKGIENFLGEDHLK